MDELVPVFFEADVDDFNDDDFNDVDDFNELVPVFFEADLDDLDDNELEPFFFASVFAPVLGDVYVVYIVDVILDVFKLSDSFEIVLFSLVF